MLAMNRQKFDERDQFSNPVTDSLEQATWCYNLGLRIQLIPLVSGEQAPQKE